MPCPHPDNEVYWNGFNSQVQCHVCGADIKAVLSDLRSGALLEHVKAIDPSHSFVVTVPRGTDFATVERLAHQLREHGLRNGLVISEEVRVEELPVVGDTDLVEAVLALRRKTNAQDGAALLRARFLILSKGA